MSSLVVGDGGGYIRFGQDVQVVSVIEGTGVTATLSVEPASVAAFFTDNGDGTGTFLQDEVDTTWQTTQVTFSLAVEVGGCEETYQVSAKVLGNVWVALKQGVVDVFRSDGVFLTQGVPSTYLDDAWSVFQLDDETVLVGQRWADGVEMFDLDGNHVGSFDTKDPEGQYLYSVYGAYTIMRHQPDGRLWVGGPRDKILVYDDAGTWLETIDLWWDSIEVEDLVQLPSGDTILIDDSYSWELRLLDEAGEDIGDYGDTESTEIKLTTAAATLGHDGKVLLAGRSGSPATYGRLVLLKQAGQFVKASELFEDFEPDYGVVTFGNGYLGATDAGTLVEWDADLAIIDAAWTGEDTGDYRGLMVLGGN